MKQELVRTKSKISSLKREMSSIQQLHLAQQQVHAQLSAPTIVSPRQESYQQNHYYLQQSPPLINDIQNLSISNNDESLLPPPPFNIANPSSSTQTPPLNRYLSANDHQIRRSTSATPAIHVDSSTSPSDEQLRLYLAETLQREKDSAV
jgi:hypothetical protein